MKTELNDRILWQDGCIETDPATINNLLLAGVCPSRLISLFKHDDIDQFNRLSEEQILFEKTTCADVQKTWLLPQEYKDLDIEDYLRRAIRARRLPSSYEDRLDEELKLVNKFGLGDMIRCLIFIIDEFKKNKIVWGVGRGSSCASFILNLIGVHCVDPVKYDINPSEFFHD